MADRPTVSHPPALLSWRTGSVTPVHSCWEKPSGPSAPRRTFSWTVLGQGIANDCFPVPSTSAGVRTGRPARGDPRSPEPAIRYRGAGLARPGGSAPTESTCDTAAPPHPACRSAPPPTADGPHAQTPDAADPMVIDLMAISTVVALGPLHSSTLILLLSTRPGPASDRGRGVPVAGSRDRRGPPGRLIEHQARRSENRRRGRELVGPPDRSPQPHRADPGPARLPASPRRQRPPAVAICVAVSCAHRGSSAHSARRLYRCRELVVQ